MDCTDEKKGDVLSCLELMNLKSTFPDKAMDRNGKTEIKLSIVDFMQMRSTTDKDLYLVGGTPVREEDGSIMYRIPKNQKAVLHIPSNIHMVVFDLFWREKDVKEMFHYEVRTWCDVERRGVCRPEGPITFPWERTEMGSVTYHFSPHPFVTIISRIRFSFLPVILINPDYPEEHKDAYKCVLYTSNSSWTVDKISLRTPEAGQVDRAKAASSTPSHL